MRLHWFLPSLLGTLLIALPAHAGGRLVYWKFNANQRRLDIVTQRGVAPKAQLVTSPNRIVIDLPNTKLTKIQLQKRRRVQGVGKRIRRVRIGQFNRTTTRLVIELNRKYRVAPQAVKVRGIATNRWFVQLPAPVKMSRAERRRAKLQRRPIAIAVPRPTSVRTAGVPSRPSRPSRPQTSRRPRPSSRRVSQGRLTVVLDPGHGGRDPGAVGIGGLQEKRVVFPITQEIARILRGRGINVVFTRNSDVEVDLAPRVSVAERARARIFVSVHANAVAGRRSDVNGLETYYYRDGLRLAQAIHRSITRSIQVRDRGVRQARFYLLRKTSMPANPGRSGFCHGTSGRGQLEATVLSQENGSGDRHRYSQLSRYQALSSIGVEFKEPHYQSS